MDVEKAKQKIENLMIHNNRVSYLYFVLVEHNNEGD